MAIDIYRALASFSEAHSGPIRPFRRRGDIGTKIGKINLYDIIGDFHGHATGLELLMAKIGYQDANGVFRNPACTVVFEGDFIDRGPQIRLILEIARCMVEKKLHSL